MISFRYHLVSIIAVFLALALGIIVGASGLRGPVLDDLHKQVATLKGENSKLRGQNDQLTEQFNNADRFASTYASEILKDTLTGHTVAIISAPGADSSIAKGIRTAVVLGGGTVTTQLSINPAWAEPSHADALIRFVTGAAHPAGLNYPDSTDAPTLGAVLLSYVLSGKGGENSLLTVARGLSQLGLVSVSDNPKVPRPAQLVVLVTSGTYPAKDKRTEAMLNMITEFSITSLPTMVGGNLAAAQPSGLISVVRADKVSELVSTVDDAGSALGQVTSAQALAGLLTNTVGQYGTGPGAKELFPAPAK